MTIITVPFEAFMTLHLRGYEIKCMHGTGMSVKVSDSFFVTVSIFIRGRC